MGLSRYGLLGVLLAGCVHQDSTVEDARARARDFRAAEQQRKDEAHRQAAAEWERLQQERRAEDERRAAAEQQRNADEAREHAEAAELHERIAQQEREQNEARAADLAAERAQRDAELQQTARQHGCDGVLPDVGLVDVLDRMIERAVPIATLKNVAILLGDDDDFVAVQVLGNGTALFTSESTDARIIMRARKGTVYQGTGVAALGFEAVKIVGVVNYRNVAGATSQAFAVEGVW